MSTNTAHSPALPALGILDLRPTLLTATDALADTPVVCPIIPPFDFLPLADRLAELYEMVFPDETEWLDEAIGGWRDDEDVSQAMGRFLERVGRLFPVYEDVWEIDLEGIEWRLFEIPLVPLGYDEWHDEWDGWKEPAPYLLYMSYARRDDDPPDGRAEFAALYPDHLVPRNLEPQRLVTRLRELNLPEPLDALPDLIEMLDHNTGNSWLDTGEMALVEGGGHPPWTAENVAWLAAEWQAAQPVAERAQRLLDWQEQTPVETADKLTAVRDALATAWEELELEEEGVLELELEEEGEDG
ncbi:MAG: hypothetical protein IPM39_09450 [Chloroflexi bacterium]|nr:hypothetical protein [Chloroflexota bacterium]